MTKRRSATSFYGSMSLEKLLQGRKWVGGIKEDKKFILWRLQCAHMHAFEMQAMKNKAAVTNGEWESRPAGTINVFDPTEWHAGQPVLEESQSPEVLLLFQFARAEVADFYDEHLNADGGVWAVSLDSRQRGFYAEGSQQTYLPFFSGISLN